MHIIDFIRGDSDQTIASVLDGPVPRVDEYINIRKKTFKIQRVDWCVDHADAGDGFKPTMRANVILTDDM
jgi:hypothetical protein